MPTLGGKTRSPEVARYLAINWIDSDVPRVGGDGYGEAKAPASTLGRELGDRARPTLVYFYNAEVDLEEAEKLEQKMFGKDEFALLSHYFQCLRISSAGLTEDDRDAYTHRGFGYLVFDAQGELLAKLPGLQKARKLTRLLGKAWSEVYDENPSRRLRALEKTLDELEEAEDAVADLGRRVATCEERVAKSDRRKNVEQLEEAKAEAEKAREALVAARSRFEELLAVQAESTASN